MIWICDCNNLLPHVFDFSCGMDGSLQGLIKLVVVKAEKEIPAPFHRI